MIIDPNLEQETPLAFRMMEHIPGVAASMGFSTMRGSRTMMYGGFMDNAPTIAGKSRQARRAARFAIVQDGVMSTPGAGGFYGGVSGRGILGRRATRAAAANKTPFLRSARLNNITARPRALTRFHSMSVFSGAEGVYSPFAASSFLGNTKFGKGLVDRAGIQLKEGEKAFGPGLLSGITAGTKVDALERRALKGSSRAAAKLTTINQSTLNLARMNNPNLMARSAVQAAKKINTTGSTKVGMSGMTAQQRLAQARASGFSGTVFDQAMKSAVTAEGVGTVGVRGNLMASSLTGAFTSFAAGYARGAQGFGGVAGLTGRALEGAARAEAAFGKAFGQVFSEAGFQNFAKTEGVQFLRNTAGKNIIRELGIKNTLAVARSGGGMALGVRGLAAALPVVNVLATASLVYDLGKMGGELVKSGINLARDANRSLQGSIAKPAFGMGYKDTEAAATSRARGVMAIQNSRLNARSMLGAEGAMMAAHYG